MTPTPLTVPEANAILRADEALDSTFPQREASGQLLSCEEADAWIRLVKSARDRVASYEGVKPEAPKVTPYPGGNEPDFQTLFMEAVANQQPRTGYTIKRLTAADAAELAELLRVSLDDKHWQAWHPRLREFATEEKLAAAMKDIGIDYARVAIVRDGRALIEEINTLNATGGRPYRIRLAVDPYKADNGRVRFVEPLSKGSPQ
jgi:hypothetical protein